MTGWTPYWAAVSSAAGMSVMISAAPARKQAYTLGNTPEVHMRTLMTARQRQDKIPLASSWARACLGMHARLAWLL